jgi:hypothetical protein
MALIRIFTAAAAAIAALAAAACTLDTALPNVTQVSARRGGRIFLWIPAAVCAGMLTWR